MAKAAIRNTRQTESGYVLLPEGPRNLVIDEVVQERGYQAPYAHFILHDMETGKRLDVNCTLGTEDDDTGVWAIQEFFDAVNGCPTNQPVDLTVHDFESEDDNMRLVGSVVIGDVYQQRYQGRTRNKVGQISAARPIPGWDVVGTTPDSVPEPATVSSK